MTTEPKVLYFDIETTPDLVFAWGLGKQYINYESLYKERKVSCICYKWGHEKKVHTLQMDMTKHDLNAYDDDSDKEMLEKFTKIYKEADLAVAHNGVKFDLGKIRSRLLKHKLPDIAPVIVDDTYLQSKHIGTNCHRLDYIAKYLGLGGKSSHPYSLWIDIMHGSKKALQAMVSYCSNDVVLLEKIYKRLLPYIKTKLNRSVFKGDNEICPNCSGTLVGDGKRVAVGLGLRQRFKCKDCGKHFTKGAKGKATPS